MSTEPSPAVAPQQAARRAGRNWKWTAFRIVRIPVLAYLGVVVVLMFLENSMVYFPMPHPAGEWTSHGLRVEDAYFTADDGVRLHGWYLHQDNPRAVVLFAHGNAGNITHRAAMLERLQELRVSVLIFDYRGYGRSEGSPSEHGILADARAARAWLAQRAGVNTRDIVLLGESIGTGVMVDLAAEDGARALVLYGAFTSLPDVAAVHYRWLPVKLFMRNRFDSASKIGKYQGPLLQAHGDIDEIVPFSNARKLFEAANEPKEFLSMPGRDHNSSWPSKFYEALDALIDRLPASN